MKLIFQHTKQSCADWEKWLRRHILPINGIVAMEAGNNSFELVSIANRLGIQSVVLDSYMVGRLAKNLCKNDKKDAVKIARVYFSGLADEVWQPDEMTRIRREILSGYLRAVRDSTRYINRTKSYLSAHKIRLGKGMHLRKESTRKFIFSSYKWTSEQRFQLTRLIADYDAARQSKDEYLKHIGETVLINPLMRQLMRLCGIRLIAAYTIISAVGDINRFDNPKKLVAYLGIAPGIKQSGSVSRNKGVRYGGRSSAKSIMTQAAHAILKSKNGSGKKIREWGVKLIMRKNRNIAVCAVARKIIVSVWYAMKGYLPHILEEETDLKVKLQKIALELGAEFRKNKLGYNSLKEFTEEYAQLILFHKHLSYGKSP